MEDEHTHRQDMFPIKIKTLQSIANYLKDMALISSEAEGSILIAEILASLEVVIQSEPSRHEGEDLHVGS